MLNTFYQMYSNVLIYRVSMVWIPMGGCLNTQQNQPSQYRKGPHSPASGAPPEFRAWTTRSRRCDQWSKNIWSESKQVGFFGINKTEAGFHSWMKLGTLYLILQDSNAISSFSCTLPFVGLTPTTEYRTLTTEEMPSDKPTAILA